MEESELRSLAVELAVLWNRRFSDDMGRKERHAVESRFDVILSIQGMAVVDGALAILRRYNLRPYGEAR